MLRLIILFADMRPVRSTPTSGMCASLSTPTPTWTFTTWSTSISTKVQMYSCDTAPWNKIASGKILETNKYDDEYRVMYLLSVFYCHNTDKDILSK